MLQVIKFKFEYITCNIRFNCYIQFIKIYNFKLLIISNLIINGRYPDVALVPLRRAAVLTIWVEP